MQELLRHVANGALDPGFSLDPGSTAQLVELGLGALGRGILLDEIQPFERNINAIAAVIEQNHAFPVVNERDAAVGADAVVDMDHVIAGLQILKIRNECGELLTTTMRRLCVLDFVEDIRLGINQQVRPRANSIRRKSGQFRQGEPGGHRRPSAVALRTRAERECRIHAGNREGARPYRTCCREAPPEFRSKNSFEPPPPVP